MSRLEPIGLGALEEVTLLSRVDTKYVLGIDQLCDCLSILAEDCRVLDVGGVRVGACRVYRRALASLGSLSPPATVSP